MSTHNAGTAFAPLGPLSTFELKSTGPHGYRVSCPQQSLLPMPGYHVKHGSSMSDSRSIHRHPTLDPVSGGSQN